MANTKKTVLASLLGETTLVRGISSILIFLVIWQIGALCDDWFGVDILGIGLVPPPTDVFIAFLEHMKSEISALQKKSGALQNLDSHQLLFVGFFGDF